MLVERALTEGEVSVCVFIERGCESHSNWIQILWEGAGGESQHLLGFEAVLVTR